jgi:hypothetical protein
MKTANQILNELITDPKEFITCPFCGEEDFDKPGLKSHLEHGDCEVWNNTERIKRMW